MFANPATFNPARYSFYVEPVNTANPFSTPMATSMAQAESFSDIKKGYCDDSSLYSDDYDSQGEDYLSNHSQDDMDVVQDTYTSEQDSEASHSGSVHSSSDDSSDESEGSEDMSVEDYCPAYPTLDARETDTSSTPAVQEYSSFSSSCVDEGPLRDRITSAQPSGPPTGIDMGMGSGEWHQISDADQSIYLTSTSAIPTSETENFDFNMDTDEPRPTKNTKSVSDGYNKARPFSNSINELCEPAPEVDAVALEADSTAPEADGSKVPVAQDASDLGSPFTVDHAPLGAGEPDITTDSTTIKLSELVQVESTRAKRSASEAELDAQSIPEIVSTVKAHQVATPEQMSKRRIASITRRARDLSIGVVVGGVAVFTVLASMGEGA